MFSVDFLREALLEYLAVIIWSYGWWSWLSPSSLSSISQHYHHHYISECHHLYRVIVKSGSKLVANIGHTHNRQSRLRTGAIAQWCQHSTSTVWLRTKATLRHSKPWLTQDTSGAIVLVPGLCQDGARWHFLGFSLLCQPTCWSNCPPPPLSTRIFRLYTLFYHHPMPSSTHHCWCWWWQ